MSTEASVSAIPEFDPKLMNEALDLSDPAYASVLEKNRNEEDERARRRDEALKSRSLFQKVVDSLIPA